MPQAVLFIEVCYLFHSEGAVIRGNHSSSLQHSGYGSTARQVENTFYKLQHPLLATCPATKNCVTSCRKNRLFYFLRRCYDGTCCSVCSATILASALVVIALQVAGKLPCVTDPNASRNVAKRLLVYFNCICNAIFCCETTCEEGMLRASSFASCRNSCFL